MPSSAEAPPSLRQRRVDKTRDPQRSPSDFETVTTGSEVTTKRDEVVWGKTPSGEVFRVPTTHDVLTLFHPGYPKSHVDLFNLFLLGTQLVLYYTLPRTASQIFFFLYFAFWRAAYDVGLAWVLTKQSKRKWMVKEIQRLGWLDERRKPEVRQWIKKQLAGKMGKDYSFDELPLEYNTWLLFRQLVDIILLNDFVAYCMFAFSCFRVPEGLSMTLHVMRWIGGIALIGFNLWVKTEAHNVIKDYGWYWGDVFFQRGALIFDGVFELAPHPMYSVGYVGYYGLSLIVGSYAVLFVSLAAHAAQFGFLVFFENPHIEFTYGQRKPLASRSPIQTRVSRIFDDSTASHSRSVSLSSASTQGSTPTATEGDTATESEELLTDANTEQELETTLPASIAKTPNKRLVRVVTSKDHVPKPRETSRPVISQHDMFHKYFRKDAILLHNIDLLRASDFQLVLVLFYAAATVMLPKCSLTLHFLHALAWCLFHTVGLGLLLSAQSQSKFLVRHYLKHYHYPQGDRGQGAVHEAFQNWKAIYNLSMCMTYISVVSLAFKTYSIPQQWTVGNELLRHTLGFLMIALHVWSSLESYEVLGVFGWFFGDFFIEDFPSHLEYTGIYRYLNNPDVIGAAAYFGLALISGSKLVFILAVIRDLAQWWFLSRVENPHMRKLYGDSIRRDAGFVKVIKNVAQKNAEKLLEVRAGRHAPQIKRVVREVKGTFDKVYEETAEVVEDFLAKSRPKISEVVQDTKVLLQQSRERLVITRVAKANDLSSYDANKYKVSIVPSADGILRFHLGEPIRVQWRAPRHHSRKDWIGIYRVGANQSRLITKTSSLGVWIPVHDDEWDGDVPLHHDGNNASDAEEGELLFKGGVVPWRTGSYEVRYHHDGKYNVMSLDGPLEIFVDKPDQLDFSTVRNSLMRIVPLCLDSDPSLIPQSCKTDASEEPTTPQDGRDPDDFRFWSERQAKRISGAIEQAFDVELTPEVIVADANISALANRILVSKELLSE